MRGSVIMNVVVNVGAIFGVGDRNVNRAVTESQTLRIQLLHHFFPLFNTLLLAVSATETTPLAMQLLSALSLGAATALITTATAQTLPANLVGTWTTKSNQTLTGPVRDGMIGRYFHY